MLVLELWGLGDLALAMPFLHTASEVYAVTLLAKPQAGPLLKRFAPETDLVPFDFPWTAFEGKYRLHRWPWRALLRCLETLRRKDFRFGISARPDPREHVLLSLLRCERRLGFARLGDGLLLSDPLSYPVSQHRGDYWMRLGEKLEIARPLPPRRRLVPKGGRIAIHTGAARAVRQWPRSRWEYVGRRLEELGWKPVFLEDAGWSLDRLLDELEKSDAFLGNDSGPGHLAALLGVPTFTLFGPQLPERFSPVHPQAAWMEGGPCPYKPCKDLCRFPSARCMEAIEARTAAKAIVAWLESGAENGGRCVSP